MNFKEPHYGRVKSWSPLKGYGFITPTDGSVFVDEHGKKKDIFVHFSCILGNGVKNLYSGQEVKFACIPSNKTSGVVAYYVEPLQAWYDQYSKKE